jgi:hypothetical protein
VIRLIGLVGIALEYFLLIFLPTALVLSYLYLASLRGYLEGSQRGFKLAVLLGVILAWLAAIPGPLIFLGAFVTSLFLFSLVWWPNFHHFRELKGLVRDFMKFLKDPKSRFFEGCKSFSGCVLRFSVAWPAPATIASTLQGILAPTVLFATGYAINVNTNLPDFVKDKPYAKKLENFTRVIMTLIAWGYAIMNILKNILLPHWILMQEYILSGETSKLPLTARLMALLFGKTAAYVYGILIVALVAYTAYRIFRILSRAVGGPYTFTALAPIIGYALAANKLGEPMTSIGYALGMTIALKGIDLSATGRFLLKLEGINYKANIFI